MINKDLSSYLDFEGESEKSDQYQPSPYFLFQVTSKGIRYFAFSLHYFPSKALICYYKISSHVAILKLKIFQHYCNRHVHENVENSCPNIEKKHTVSNTFGKYLKILVATSSKQTSLCNTCTNCIFHWMSSFTYDFNECLLNLDLHLDPH